MGIQRLAAKFISPEAWLTDTLLECQFRFQEFRDGLQADEPAQDLMCLPFEILERAVIPLYAGAPQEEMEIFSGFLKMPLIFIESHGAKMTDAADIFLRDQYTNLVKGLVAIENPGTKTNAELMEFLARELNPELTILRALCWRGWPRETRMAILLLKTKSSQMIAGLRELATRARR